MKQPWPRNRWRQCFWDKAIFMKPVSPFSAVSTCSLATIPCGPVHTTGSSSVTVWSLLATVYRHCFTDTSVTTDATLLRDLALYSQHLKNWQAAANFFAAAFAARPRARR